MDLHSPLLLSILVPLYNEEGRLHFLDEDLEAFLGQWKDLHSPEELEILLVDDGSKDRTTEGCHALKDRFLSQFPGLSMEVHTLKENRQKGGALAYGAKRAQGKWILTMDGDASLPSTQLLRWLREKRFSWEEENTLCIACRNHPDTRGTCSFRRKLLGRVYNFFFQFLFSSPLKDTQCGFKLYPASLAKEIFGDLVIWQWHHDIELLVRAQSLGWAIREMPLEWEERGEGKIRVLKDSVTMFLGLFQIKVLQWGWTAKKAWKEKNLSYFCSLFCFFAFFLFLIFFSPQHRSLPDRHSYHLYGEDILSYYTFPFFEAHRAILSPMASQSGFFPGLFAWMARNPFLGVRISFAFFVKALLFLFFWYLYRLGYRLTSSRIFSLVVALGIGWFLVLRPDSIPLRDLPFLVFVSMTLFYLVESIPFWREEIYMALRFKLSVALSLCLASRVEGVLLILAFFLAWGIYRIFLSRVGLAELIKNLLLLALVPYLFMVFLWPWSHQDPLMRPWKILIWGGFAAVGPLREEIFFWSRDLFAQKIPFLLTNGLGLLLALVFFGKEAFKEEKIQRAFFFFLLTALFSIAFLFLSLPWRNALLGLFFLFLWILGLVALMKEGWGFLLREGDGE